MTNDEKQIGSVTGGSLLIAGCCIGAGMLALPIKTGIVGFYPFLILFVLCWMFMTATGLLLLEVNLWLGNDANIISMTKCTMGKAGQIIGWFVFCFLFYSLMIAYVSGCSNIFQSIFQGCLGITPPIWLTTTIVSISLGSIVFLGTNIVDHFNRIFMIGLVITYLLLVVFSIKHVKQDLLGHCNWIVAIFSLPIMVIMFGYHNLIPTLTIYLKNNAKKITLSIIIGSIISFLICLLWEWIVLGIVPLEGDYGIITASEKGYVSTQLLQNIVGIGILSNISLSFSLFAIVTSCLGVALSFVDFLSDGLKITNNNYKNRLLLCSFVIAPAFIFSLLSPKVFFIALDFAGGFAAVILFGIFPAIMVWIGRYHKNIANIQILPGGRFALVLVILLSLCIFTLEMIHECGWSFIKLSNEA